jgi:CHAT domain-containing protein/tetratricopeptide (TPR) repeat protein
MASLALRESQAVLLGLCLFFSSVLAESNVQATDELIIRTLVENYFAAYANEDLDAITRLWSDKSPTLGQTKGRLKEFFSLNDQIETKNLSIRQLLVEGDSATALAMVEVAATDARTKAPSQGLGKMNEKMSFRREAGEWRIWQSVAAEEELATRLIAANSDSKRDALLAEARDLLIPALANALFRAGERFRFRQDLEQALTAYRLQLLLAERAANKQVMAAALNNLALVYRGQGNYEQALDSAQKSLKLKDEIGNKAGAANTLDNVADVFLSQGNYAAAIEALHRMLTISEELNDKRLTAKALSRYAIVQEAEGNTTAALDYNQRSLTLCEELGDRILYSGVLQSIGSLQLELGNYKAALDAFRKNLTALEASGHKAGAAHAMRDIARVYSAQGDHRQAMESLQRALDLMAETGFKEGIADILRGTAIEQIIFGDYEGAISSVERSSDLERQIGSPSRLASSLTIAGQAYQALGRIDEARRAFDEAIALIEILRTQLAGGEQERQRYFEERTSPYNSMVALLVAQNKPEEALVYAERATARVLLDVIRGGRVNITKAMSIEEREKEKRLADDIASINRYIAFETARQKADPSRLADLKARLEKARFAHTDFQAGLYASHPELRVKRGQSPPFALEQAGELVADSHTALLEYVVAEDKTFLFVLTAPTQKGSQKPLLTLYDLKINRKDLVDRVRKLNQRIANNDIDFAPAASDLYNLLIAPARRQLQGKTRLIVVPTDILWDAPFQALRSADGRFLIQDAAISYAPSLTVLREIVKSRTPHAGNTLLAMGNPTLAGQTISRSKGVLMTGSFEPLPDAERMVRGIARVYGANVSKVYVGSEAREDILKSEVGHYRILQLATHGVINNASPLYSYVVLAQGSKEDGLLEAWEIMNLDLKADLTVLSACDTARGRIGAGEGVIGLSWALFVAGCPTTIVSQWSVESSSTTELMLAFHRNLKSGFSKSEALRQAAIKLMTDKKHGHPFYWAGFIVVGDPN